MGAFERFRWWVVNSFLQNWRIEDKPRIFYYYMKPFLSKFGFCKLTNKVLTVQVDNEMVYFRDNWGELRSIHTMFSPDYPIKKCKTFVDVGANLGLVSRYVTRNWPECKVICFEALMGNAKLCALNNPRAKVECYAVGQKNGTVELLVDEYGFMGSKIKFNYEQKTEKIPVITLDSYFEGREFDIDLMKIDVEGMEIDVLLGAKKVLKKTNTVTAEVHSDPHLKRFTQLMKDSGFLLTYQKKLENGCYIVVFDKTKNPLPDALVSVQ